MNTQYHIKTAIGDIENALMELQSASNKATDLEAWGCLQMIEKIAKLQNELQYFYTSMIQDKDNE